LQNRKQSANRTEYEVVLDVVERLVDRRRNEDEIIASTFLATTLSWPRDHEKIGDQ
jgi:hypothetical protein